MKIRVKTLDNIFCFDFWSLYFYIHTHNNILNQRLAKFTKKTYQFFPRNLQHNKAHPTAYAVCTSVIYITQPHLHVEHHKEKQLVLFKVFGLTGLGWIRTLDLPNSQRILYHYTIKSVKKLILSYEYVKKSSY